METPSTTAVTASLFPCPVPVSTLQAFAVAFTKGHVFTTMIGPGTEPEDGAASDGRARMAMAMAMAAQSAAMFIGSHPRARCSREKRRRFSWNVTHEKQRFRFLVFLLAKRFPVARDETEPWRRRRPGWARPPAQGWHWSVRSVLAESVGPRGPRHRAREPPRPSSLFSPRESRVEPAHKGERELAVQGREREREREREGKSS